MRRKRTRVPQTGVENRPGSETNVVKTFDCPEAPLVAKMRPGGTNKPTCTRLVYKTSAAKLVKEASPKANLALTPVIPRDNNGTQHLPRKEDARDHVERARLCKQKGPIPFPPSFPACRPSLIVIHRKNRGRGKKIDSAYAGSEHHNGGPEERLYLLFFPLHNSERERRS